MSKFYHHRTLRQVITDSKVETGPLLPVHIDGLGISNFLLKVLVFGVIMHTISKLKKQAVFSQQRGSVAY